MEEKLIRDKIPNKIMKDGDSVSIRMEIDAQKRYDLLVKKLKEEINEFNENPCLDEMSDVVEVMLTMLDVDINDLEKRLIMKRQNNGRFENFYVLRLDDD